MDRILIGKKKIVIAVTLIFALITIIYFGRFAYGKYYASRHNKGVAVASDFYFNSDKLKKSIGHTDIDELILDTASINKINIFVNSGSWSAGDTKIPFTIRNYDNNILYNESGLDVDYKVEFVLLDEPVGAEYYVKGTDGSYNQLSHAGDKYVTTGTVNGGSAHSNTYDVQIRLTALAADYMPARVLVMAYPTSPDFIYKNTNENQEYRLLGIIEGQTTDAEMSIESARFVVQEDDTYSELTWYNLVKDLSAYIYNIKTIGDVVIDQGVATKQLAVIKWDNRYVDIDQYNSYYTYAKSQDEALLLAGDDRYLIVDGNYTYMKIMILPYESIDIIFYKTGLFNETFENGGNTVTNKAWFEGLVEATMPE